MTKITENTNRVFFLDVLLERAEIVKYNSDLRKDTLKLYEEMCIEYYYDFYKVVEMKEYIRKMKIIFYKLIFVKSIKIKTKIRWAIFLISTKSYRKFIYKNSERQE